MTLAPWERKGVVGLPEMLTAVKDVGFPVLVALLLLLQQQGFNTDITRSLALIAERLDRCVPIGQVQR